MAVYRGRSTWSLAARNVLVDMYAQYAYTPLMSPTFDPAKSAANMRKHGVPLSDGDGVLYDPLALTVEDMSIDSEQRFVTIGVNVFGALMVVVFSHRHDDVRFISVRRATPKERRIYEKGI